MKKYLIVAHPDDEIIWFNPENYDRIVIVFLDRKDNPVIMKGRLAVKECHPLRDRITWLGMTESNYWRDKSQAEIYAKQYYEICAKLKQVVNKPCLIVTHAKDGEYGHSDHILVHRAVVDTFQDCTIVFKDMSLKERIKKCYEENKCFTWGMK